MRASKKRLRHQRDLIENRLRRWIRLRSERPPRSGWIKAIRGALGITTYQLADLMGVNQATTLRLEQRESQGKVTLESIERAARAMDCKLIYAIVPREKFSSLDAILSHRANKLADNLLKEVEHNMQLEKQGTSINLSQKRKLVEDLKSNIDSRLWEKTRKR